MGSRDDVDGPKGDGEGQEIQTHYGGVAGRHQATGGTGGTPWSPWPLVVSLLVILALLIYYFTIAW